MSGPVTPGWPELVGDSHSMDGDVEKRRDDVGRLAGYCLILLAACSATCSGGGRGGPIR